MGTLLQRLCWNSNGWRGPTGDAYRKEDSYVGKNGFGHEEWNLNTADLIDGKVYGYTYYNPPQNKPLAPYDVYFFAVAPDKTRLLVGTYENACFLSNEERRRLSERLKGSEYLGRRAKELVALRLPHLQSEESALRLLLGDFALNICAAPECVVAFLPPRTLQPSDTGGRDPRVLNRYTKPVFLAQAPSRKGSLSPAKSPVQAVLPEDAYVRFTPAQQQVILRRHNELSNRFRTWLSAVGATAVSAESESIDVSCSYSGRSCLFELKTCYALSPRHALREALGQVLEYAFYPGRTRCDHLAVVLDTAPATTDIEWFQQLKLSGIIVDLFWLIGEAIYSARVTAHPLATQACKATEQR